MAGFDFKIVDEFDHVFDEKGNSFLAFRKIDWGNKGNPKYDLRKYYNNADGEEIMGKGFSFLTEEGPNELVKVLTENGFGHTDEILDAIKDREEFLQCLSDALDGCATEQLKAVEKTEEYHDASAIFG